MGGWEIRIPKLEGVFVSECCSSGNGQPIMATSPCVWKYEWKAKAWVCSFIIGHDVGQKWDRKSDNALRNIQSGKCLTSPSADLEIAGGQELLASDCDGSLEQVWNIEFRN